jgi:hypothetical protein
LLWSFLFEGFLLLMIMMLATTFFNLQRSMAWLQKKENILKIDKLKEYEEE